MSSVEIDHDDGVSVDVKALIKKLNKELGDEGTILCGTDIPDPFTDRISTGLVSLDLDIGGGMPNGITQYIGMESSGKTTMALHAVVEAQKRYGDDTKIVYVSAETPLNIEWAKKVGVKLNDNFILLRAATGEKYLDAIKCFIDSNEIHLIIIDSIPALASVVEMEKDMEAMSTATTARLIARFIRRCVYSAKGPTPTTYNKTHILEINQYYSKIGGWSPTGDAKDQQGGRALRHAKLVDVEFASAEKLSEGTGDAKVIFGKTVRYRVIKSKAGAPEGGVGTFDLYTHDHELFKAGEIDVAKDYKMAGIKQGVIVRAGRYFNIGDDQFTKEELNTVLSNDEGFRSELKAKIFQAAGIVLT